MMGTILGMCSGFTGTRTTQEVKKIYALIVQVKF